MVLLIVATQDTGYPSLDIDVVTFKVLEGSPNISELTHWLNLKYNGIFTLSYGSTQKQGQFFTVGRIFKQGQRIDLFQCHDFYY